ncbi:MULTISPECIES: GspE/PulE family protein [unclassified Methylocaldum]|jgi:general secretion pathway protein E|uniref:GspE/PulE family protein n=1 Tax=unclassified Methylocaldum TaxID=2622260 RepID=UPI000A32737A|nr:GspE/PulE family protein [Methylocaldum sp. RMAD-M]MBP1152669.1 general secretion pathway protein E [Methylocaldum sp. RMAD-M]MVF24524.1 type II/IV secretion system protein [Methylocaldum sp. BRCS4]
MAVTTAVSASSTDSTDRLVEILLRRRLMSAESVERVQAAARSSETPFSAVATRLGLVTEDQMAEIFAEMLAIEVAKRARFPARLPEIDGVNLHFFRTKRALPLVIDQDEVHLAMADPTDDVTAAGVEFLLGKPVKRYAALESELEDYFYKLDAAQAEAEEAISLASIGTAEVNDDDVAKLSDHASDAPVIRLVHRLIMSASDLGASDVHVEPAANALIIRYRIDGLLQEADVLSARWAEPVASRIKLMARLDIAERRVPQDGRIRFSARGRSLDLRVATFPTLHGESIVLRLLGQVSVKLELDQLGLSDHGLNGLRKALKKPHGIVLITGPTGSGKTTTLYASLNAILNPELKIVTVEDPIEYVLTGVSQLQVKPEIGLTYATSLRSILRNDPDIIMIGEIRDRETADIAIRAALTGHLVLSTLHTNTAAGAVTRLLDLGVEAYLLASTLELAAAQRLVRRLCPHCKIRRSVTKSEAEMIGHGLGKHGVPEAIYGPKGCEHCNGRGYWGRTPLFEAIEIEEEEREIIRMKQDERMLVDASVRRGGRNLWQHGLAKVVAGETAIDEVLRVMEWREH